MSKFDPEAFRKASFKGNVSMKSPTRVRGQGLAAGVRVLAVLLILYGDSVKLSDKKLQMKYYLLIKRRMK